MIEQPRLAALGIAIMALGVLWMGLPYLRGSGAGFAESTAPDDASESAAAESTVDTPSETDDVGTDTEAEPANDGRSVGADDAAAGAESPATDDSPDESASAADP